MIVVAVSILSSVELPCFRTSASAAEECPNPADAIATDRPDVTNSSIVVPTGSLQSENGINFSARNGAQIIDGTNSRLRFGVAPCLEVLVDVPTSIAAVRGEANQGFSNVAPAIKWQISPLPGKFDLSATVGAGLPTGTPNITGPGLEPYLQFPWSWELTGGWESSGMVTLFTFPANPVNKLTTEVNFVLEKKFGETRSLFVELVGDYPEHAGPSLLLNSGGVYRITKTQQIDFHVGFGLSRNAPDYIVGVGYSFRIDGLFGDAR